MTPEDFADVCDEINDIAVNESAAVTDLPAEAITAARTAHRKAWQSRLSPQNCADLALEAGALAIRQQATTAERERIRQLAVDSDAICWPAVGDDDDDGVSDRKFADLLRDQDNHHD